MAKRKRTLESYKQPIHDDDCGVYRNKGMSVLGAHTVNQVLGEPSCTCGLQEALKEPTQQPFKKYRRPFG